MLLACLAHGVRANDALNATLWLEGDVIVGRTTVRSKDGLPLGLFAPAHGWLGPWHWAAEHIAAMEARGHALADFSAQVPSQAHGLRPGVLPVVPLAGAGLGGPP